MNKYAEMVGAVHSVFDSTDWKAEGIVTVPSNFPLPSAPSRSPVESYVRVSVVPGSMGINLVSSSGQIIIDIFTPAGGGPLPAARIADKLDKYLVGKKFSTSSGTVQCFDSSYNETGLDIVNTSLARAKYSISMSFFGEF
jgi:hypothetical protein